MIARWLSENLRRPGWSQKKLADESTVSRPTIWAILRERADTTDETVAKLARAFGVKPPDIEGEVGTGRRMDPAQDYPEGVLGDLAPDSTPPVILTERNMVDWAEREWARSEGDKNPGATLRQLLNEVHRLESWIDHDDLRRVHLVLCEAVMKRYKRDRQAIPETVLKIYNEVIEGRFR